MHFAGNRRQIIFVGLVMGIKHRGSDNSGRGAILKNIRHPGPDRRAANLFKCSVSVAIKSTLWYSTSEIALGPLLTLPMRYGKR
jgi:hypothetical protein